jgi:hypothetical protein
MTEAMCACGLPLHYSNDALRERIEGMVREYGPNIRVVAGGQTFLVPRHYIALHGLKAAEMPSLGFPVVR